jgi:two-component system, OmpR family, phosphate regulon sensor histidine kinase PhoR
MGSSDSDDDENAEARALEREAIRKQLKRVRCAVADATGLSRRLKKDEENRDRIAEELDWFRRRIESEAARASQEEAFGRAMMEATPNGVMLLDSDGRISVVNPMALKLLELHSSPIGRRPIEAIPIVQLHNAVQELQEEGQTEEFTCAAGTYDLLFNLSRVNHKTVMIVVTDVTRFHEAQRARADFVANVSHELRTPMTAIMGYAETLLVDIERMDDDLAFLVETIHRNSRRLRDLFEDLLELHRIESRGRELHLEHLPLHMILEEAVVSAADNALRAGKDFSLSCPRGLRGWVNIEAISAIVGNLSGNACQYTEEGGEIVVRAEERPDGEVVISVSDNGIGIAEVHHERIFERFYRVDQGRHRNRGGTGLGLAIVKHLAQACECTVTLKSDLGAGTTFLLHLPEKGRTS